MGLAALGALLAILLAFIAQTPRLIARLGLAGARLDLRARAFTGYGLAFLLLALGFFLAGVPLGGSSAATAEETPAQTIPAITELEVAGTVAPEGEGTSEASGSSSGMVARPRETATPEPEATIDLAAGVPLTGTLAVETAAVEPAPQPIGTEETTVLPTVTPSPSPAPTDTPEPTMTPTPIDGPTARVGNNTSTLPVREKPDGEPLALVYRGDTVVLLSGHAFHSGGLWREISTVDGVVGWVQDVFLDYGEG